MEENHSLSQSCETYILDNEILISAYPGFIVFGKTEANRHYQQNRSFKFTSFEVQDLFKTIVAQVKFFSEDNTSEKIEKIIDVESITYYWQGITVTKTNFITKLVKFAIEKDGSTIFHIAFSLQNLNTFVYLVARCLLASLCLKDNDEQFILNVIKKAKTQIKACKTDDQAAFQIVKTYFREEKIDTDVKKSYYEQLLKYYNELIIIIKDLNDLHFSNGNT
jgi:hypothetical protein